MGELSDTVVQISVAKPDERREALAIALGAGGVCASSAVIDRALAESQGRDEEWPGLLVARVVRAADTKAGRTANRNDTGIEPIVGAVWVRFLPGRVGSVTAPQTRMDAPRQTGALLLERAAETASEANVVLLQALVEPEDTIAASEFAAAGFAHTTDLLFLVAQCDGDQSASRSSRPTENAIEWVAYTAEQHNRLADLVERTYVASRDCPELDGIRAIDDVLAGYRATGEFAPERWLIATQAGHDVGCLLLADHPADAQWELVYLGVAPEFRGRGLGAALTHRALWMASRANRARVVLAVDAANAPALAIYRQAGFETWGRRAIFLRHSDKPREM
jgi:ribosomal protein S18 acetylase RimI-like enzyme